MHVTDRRWFIASALCVAAAIFLAWAVPRLHPAARLHLQYDRQGYLARARTIAARQHVDLTGWKGYAGAETLARNQELRIALPGDRIANDFPPARINTNFLPPGSGRGAKLTLRPDSRPLSWKLPMPSTPVHFPDLAAASQAMREIAGAAASNYSMTEPGVARTDGMDYRWWAGGSSPDAPTVRIETSIRNGFVLQSSTDFTIPDSAKQQFETFSVARIVVSSLWFVALFAGIAIPVFREGGGSAARSMKDRPAILISVAAGLATVIAGLIEWDDIMLSVSVSSGPAVEILGLLLGGTALGLLYYSMSAATVLNARLHSGSVRGFRLLGTRALVSRPVGVELLGGWLLAPLVVSLPLLTALLMRKPAFGGYEDGMLLSRMPVLQSLLSAAPQETVAMVAWAGVLIPLALRFSRNAKIRYALMTMFAFMTFAMVDSPFREYQPANYVSALLNGIAMVWLYANFGMLGAISANCSARILSSAGALLVQPAAFLQASGWETLLAFGGIGVLGLVVASKGADVVAELYGESGVRIQARSRREEILAEFNVARSAQQQMLPSNPPTLAGYTISASCEPAREVGGDLYDFLRLGDGRWGIGVADVSGKGVPAALYMTLTKGLLCAAAEESADPRLILTAVNKHLRTVTKRKMFVTMALGILDPESGRVEYVRAGHNPVVWRRTAAGETRFLAGPGIGLGIAGPALFAKTLTTETLDLAPGDALIFYSDGLTEAMNETLEQFGEERLAAAVEFTDGMHATGTRDSILSEVKRFLHGGHSQDDLTIAVLRVNAA
jgi:hypothetical protein